MFCGLHVNVHCFHPFCFLLLRRIILTVLSSSWLLLCSACSSVLSNPSTGYCFSGWGSNLHLLIVLLAVHLVSSWAMFFWVPFLGTVTLLNPVPAAPEHHRLPPGASPAFARSSPPPSWYRHLKFPSWMVFWGEMGKENKLPSILFVRRGSKLHISYLGISEHLEEWHLQCLHFFLAFPPHPHTHIKCRHRLRFGGISL